jgi:hypothetical protein
MFEKALKPLRDGDRADLPPVASLNYTHGRQTQLSGNRLI